MELDFNNKIGPGNNANIHINIYSKSIKYINVSKFEWERRNP